MAHLSGVVVGAVSAFVGTNIDDFVMLLLLVAGGGAEGPGPRQIVGGQYLGFATLLVISAAGGAALRSVPVHWLGLLAIVPLSLGIRALVQAWRSTRAPQRPAREVPAMHGGIVTVAGLTVANGGDNVSVYVLLFRQLSPAGGAGAILIFLIMLGGLCAAALAVGSRGRPIIPGIRRTGRWLTPTVLVVIGIGLIVRTGAIGVIMRRG